MKRMIPILCTLVISIGAKAQNIAAISLQGTSVTEGADDTVRLTVELDAPATNDVQIALDISADDRGGLGYKFLNQYEVSSFSGEGSSGYLDGDATTAQFGYLKGIVSDSDGNLYVTDGNRIRKIDADGDVTTFAGDGTESSLDGTGTAASFNNPHGICMDATGNLYVTDHGGHVIRMVSPAGEVTTIAGDGSPGYVDGSGTSARFQNPNAIAVDSEGNLYIAESYRIRKIDTEGNVTTFAGNGECDSRDGTGTSARFCGSIRLAISMDDELYFTDNGYGRIGVISGEGVVRSLVRDTYGHQNGPLTSAEFESPEAIVLDSAGNLYVYDNYRLRKISSAGIVSTLAGTGTSDVEDGYGTNASLEYVEALRVGIGGKIYFTQSNDDSYRIRVLDTGPYINIPAGETTGVIRFYAEDDDIVLEPDNQVSVSIGSITNASLGGYPDESYDFTVHDDDAIEPTVSVTLSDGSLIEGSGEQVILKAKQDFISGVDTELSLTIGGPAEEINDYTLSATTLVIQAGDSVATIEIGEVDNATVEVIEDLVFTVTGVTNAEGGTGTYTLSIIDDDLPTVSSLAQTGSSSITEGDGSMVVLTATLDYPASFDVIVNLDVTTDHFSDLEYEFEKKGYTTSFDSVYYDVRDVAVDPDGNIYVCETGRHRIRKIDPDGNITTFAGTGSSGSANATNPLSATFNFPTGIALDASGNLYVADHNNHVIRKISSSGVTTFAGAFGQAGDVDGDATTARFDNPRDVAVDAEGNVFVADKNNHKIRKITPEKVVTTYAGTGESGFNYSEDGDQSVMAADALFNNPAGLGFDRNGNLVVADKNNNRLRVIASDGKVTNSPYFYGPQGIALAQDGSVFVSSTNYHWIQKFENYAFSRIAGYPEGSNESSGYVDGSSEGALFSAPSGLAVDKHGNILVADQNNSRIRKISYGPKIVILAGETSAKLTFTAKDNEMVLEPSKSVSIAYSDVENANISFSTSETYDFTIEDNDLTAPEVQLNAYVDSTFQSTATLTESSEDSLIVFVRQDVVSALDTEIDLDISGTATVDTDFSVSSSMTIPAGDTSAYVVIKSLEDPGVEVLETISISIAEVSNGSAASDSVTIELFDNDLPKIENISFDATSISEEGETSISLTATLSAATSFDVSVPVTFSDHSGDFTSNFHEKGKVSILAGGTNSNFVEGTGEEASFYPIGDFVSDRAGGIYVGSNTRILKIDQEGMVTLLAGSGSSTFADGTGSDASFNYPTGLAVNLQGDIYVADQNNHRIRKVTSEGVVTTIAGDGTNGFRDGEASQARFSYPGSLVIDSEGNLYVSEQYRIRKIDTEGNVTTLVGNGECGSSDGLGAEASFCNSVYMSIDAKDVIYFASSNSNRIGTISLEGEVTSWTRDTYEFQDGSIESAGFESVGPITVGDDGTLYVFDDYRVRTISPSGTVSTLLGTGTQGLDLGVGSEASIDYVYGMTITSNGDLVFGQSSDNNYRALKVDLAPRVRVAPGETSGSLTLTAVDDEVALEPDETASVTLSDPVNAYYDTFTPADTYDFTIQDNDTELPVLTLSLDSVESINEAATDSAVVRGTIDRLAAVDVLVQFNLVGTVVKGEDYTISDTTLTITAGDSVGYVYIKAVQDEVVEIVEIIILEVAEVENTTTENDSLSLNLIDDDEPQVVSIVLEGDSVIEGGTAEVKLAATLSAPTSRDVSVVLDLGEEHLSDFGYEFHNQNYVSSFAGSGENNWYEEGGLGEMNAVASGPDGIFYVTSYDRVKRVGSNGNVSTLAGGGFGYQDGTGSEAQFRYLQGIAVDGDGNVYVADRDNYRIRKITPEGVVTTVAGDGTQGFANGQGTSARFNYPRSIVVDAEGNLYVSDQYRIRKIDPSGNVTTLAGGSECGTEDGIGAEARFCSNVSLAISPDGTLYFAENSSRFGTISTEGVVISLVNGNYGYQDGSLASARFRDLYAPTFDNLGNLYVYDDYRIRKITPEGQVSTVAGTGNEGYQDGAGTEADLHQIAGMTFGHDGNLYFTQNSSGNYRIRRVGLASQINIPAGQTTGEITFYATDDLEEEDTEPVEVSVLSAENAVMNTTPGPFTFDILDDEFGFTLMDTEHNPIVGLSNAAISWADYDRDGDKDLAIMGNSNALGTITKIYRNDGDHFTDTNQNLARMRNGDLDWVDLNNDGYPDLVTTGQTGTTGQETMVYMNEEGLSLVSFSGHNIADMLSAQMEWADFDNDGLKDLLISGLTTESELKSYLYRNVNGQGVFEQDTDFDETGVQNGDIEVVDLDIDGDKDIIFSSRSQGGLASGTFRRNTLIDRINQQEFANWSDTQLTESSLAAIRRDTSVYVFQIGVDENDAIQFRADQYYSSKSYDWETGSYASEDNVLYRSELTSIKGLIGANTKLKNGDLALADANNDGIFDIMISGEDATGTPQTHIWFSYGGTYEKMDFGIKGMRNSICEWVDVDGDGDLDIFIAGTNSQTESLIYINGLIEQRTNQAPQPPQNLRVEDLGNGNVRFEWDPSVDDYSENLGYNLRIGTTPGGAEILNPGADPETGYLLIQDQPVTSNAFYLTNLDPGNYFWSVQAVDDGFRSSGFATEETFTLQYEWKRFNLGGIVDRRIQGSDEAILEFFDIDEDEDMDILYVNESGPRLYFNEGNTYVEFKAQNSWSGNSFDLSEEVVSTTVGDLNQDGLNDLVFVLKNQNTYSSRIYFTKSALAEVSLDTVEYVGELFEIVNDENGLALTKIKILDIDNNGTNDLVIAGQTNEQATGVPRLYMMGFEKNEGVTARSYFTDLSDQIAQVNEATYDFGDFDNDMDLDFILNGSGFDGLESHLYRNETASVEENAADFQETLDEFTATVDGSVNMIDFDGDGDLDILFTGTSITGDVFELYKNRLNEGQEIFPNTTIGLNSIRESKIDLGDFNGDGYLDLLYSGLSEGEGKITRLAEFDTVTQRYLPSDFDVSHIIDAEVEFGDLDADGDLDMMITGAKKGEDNSYVFEVYLNVRNESALIDQETGSDPLGSKAPLAKRAAYESFGSGDFVVNNRPEPPNTLYEPQVTNLGNGLFEVIFDWEPGDDDFTPTSGLTYALKVGSQPGMEDVMSPGANEAGVRDRPGKGNTEYNTRWRLKLPEGTYQWAVQSVDASYNGSEFIHGLPLRVGNPENATPQIADQTFTIDENSAVGTDVGIIEATDPEADDLAFSITSGNTNDAFALDASTGELTVTSQSALNHETTPVFSLEVEVNDGNGGTATATVTVELNDVDESNNTAPSIADQVFAVDENSSTGTEVGVIEANDQDDGNQLSFSIISGNAGSAFALNIATGSLTVATASALDYETNPVFNLEIEVNDGNGGIDSAVVTVNLNDVDESGNSAPSITNQTFTIDENSTIGTLAGTIEANDPESDDLAFSITSGNTNDAFSLDAATGELTVAKQSAMDYESIPVFELEIMVDDGNGGTATAIVTVNLNDVDESGNSVPSMTDQSFTVDENSPGGTIVGIIDATDPDGDGLSYTITSGNTGNAFSVDAISGDLTVATAGALDFEITPSFELGVEVNDNNGGIAAAIITVTLNDLDEESGPLSSDKEIRPVAYPNPFRQVISVVVPADLVDQQLLVIDLSGNQLLRRQVPAPEFEIDMSEFASGIYLLRIGESIIRITKAD